MTAIATNKWRRYSQYRPSGVEWLGEVPGHWEAIPVKRRYGIQLGKMLQNNPESDSDVSVPYAKALHVLWGKVDTSDLSEMWASQTDLKQFGVKNGDLLVCEGGEAGRAGIVDSAPNPCIIQNALHRVRGKGADVSFLQYVLQTVGSEGWFDVLCNKATIAHFTREKLAELRMPMPPSFDEQRAIAAFLDRETGRIDSLIAKKERQIELLQEKRTALISHAVTKGLNSNVKMKPSGVEWLGDVPEGWEVKPLKRTFLTLNGSTPKSGEPAYWDGDIPWATPDDLGSLQGDTLNETRRMITREGFESCGTSLAPAGSIILSTRAPIGHLALAGVGLCANQGCRCLVFLAEVEKRFYYYQLLTAKQELESWGQGSTFKELSRDKLSAIYLAAPPPEEQRAIAAFLDRETVRIDALREKIRASIDKLREFRTAIISAAVTGKIDVRKEVVV